MRGLLMKLHLFPDPKAKEEAQKERAELVQETYDKVGEVAKLRRSVFEDMDFPITSFLRGTHKGLRNVRYPR